METVQVKERNKGLARWMLVAMSCEIPYTTGNAAEATREQTIKRKLWGTGSVSSENFSQYLVQE